MRELMRVRDGVRVLGGAVLHPVKGWGLGLGCGRKKGLQPPACCG